MDMEKVIKGLQEAKKYLEDKEWSDKKAAPHIDWIIKAIALLKEQPVWHVFHTRDATDEEKEAYGVDIVCECDQYPENGERFLFYEFACKDLKIQTWDEDQWTEYCSTEDGFQIVDGDAWMELPQPPMEGLE